MPDVRDPRVGLHQPQVGDAAQRPVRGESGGVEVGATEGLIRSSLARIRSGVHTLLSRARSPRGIWSMKPDTSAA